MSDNWIVNVEINDIPEKLVYSVESIDIMGSEFLPIAYLGYREFNGISHAVLAEQILTTGRDTLNVVLLILSEKDGNIDLVNIERVVESGDGLGEVIVNITTGYNIPEEPLSILNISLKGFIDQVKPFALLATKATDGVEYTFAAEIEFISGEKNVAIVTVDSYSRSVRFIDILHSNLYRMLENPLGVWP